MLMRLTGKESERALCFTSQDVVVPCMLGWCCLVEAIRESTRECQLGLLPNAEGPLVMRVLPSLGGPQCEIPYKGFASPNKSVIVVLRGLVITELATIQPRVMEVILCHVTAPAKTPQVRDRARRGARIRLVLSSLAWQARGSCSE